jgi:hypothetical protein
VAVLAASAVQAETAMRLLGIEAVEAGFDSRLLQVAEHRLYGRVGSALDNFSLGGKLPPC